MHFLTLLPGFLASTALVTANPLTLLAKRTSCSTPDGDGTCVSTSSCTGFSIAGYCPGPTDIQCCIDKSCSTPQGDGSCLNTSKGCSGGAFVPGYCPGPSTVECCVKGAGGSGQLAAFDISETQPDAFWSCAKNTYKKAVIRGYEQACGVGGEVDPDFSGSVASAKAAGLSVDAYMFPCTGIQPNGVTCKSPSTQISDFEAAVKNAGLEPVHLWLDVETCSSDSPCTCWNQGGSENEAIAKEFTSIMAKSTYKWGVYGNGNEWSSMFPSRDTDIGSNLPLWAVQDDGVPGTGTVNTFMGGWTVAYAKQYSLSVTECGSEPEGVDLDTFNG